MYFSQILFAFRVVRKYPGRTLPELCELMRRDWGEYEAVRWMVFDDRLDSLESRLKDLACVDVRDGLYFFNQDAKYLFRNPEGDSLAEPLNYLLRTDVEKFPNS